MPEAVIVAAARSPIGRAFKGALKDTRPDQLARRWCRRRWTRSRSWTRRRSMTCCWGVGCPVVSRAGTWPGWSRCCWAWTTCRGRRSPGTARPVCRPPGWRCTRSAPVRVTCSSPPGWSACPGSGSAARDTPPVTAEDPKGSGPEPVPGCAVRQRARPQPGAGAAPGRGVARPAGGRRTAGLLHQHGVDRGERRRLLRRSPGPIRTSSRYGRRRWPPRRWRTGSGPRRSPRSPSPTAR